MSDSEDFRIKVVDRRRFYLDAQGEVHEREDEEAATPAVEEPPVARREGAGARTQGRGEDAPRESDGERSEAGDGREPLWRRLRRKLWGRDREGGGGRS